MFHASLALARRIDRAEIDFCALAARAGLPGGASSLSAGGGRALCGRPGSPFNKVLGLGLDVEVSEADLDAIDEFYDAHEVPAQIELCPLAVSGLSSRLAARGYVLQAFENQLAAPLDDTMTAATVPPLHTSFSIVTSTTAGDTAMWVNAVARGFAAGERADGGDDGELPPEVMEAIRAFHHDSIARYLVRADGHAVGGGAAYIFDGVLGLTGTATIPTYRGRGIQHAVVRRMLHDARGRAEIATATTDPGSRSQRTFERFGFQVIYTRAVLVRPFHTR
ncbi:MAG TPA: GNAT family N-acetyltransferase [Vicinamibacterales bacterium]